MTDPHDDYLNNLGNCNDDGFEPEQEAETAAQRVEDEAARRVMRSSWANTKLLMKAMGID